MGFPGKAFAVLGKAIRSFRESDSQFLGVSARLCDKCPPHTLSLDFWYRICWQFLIVIDKARLSVSDGDPMKSSCDSKQTRSKKARSSRALKLSLAAVAGAAGVVADDVSAEVITANLGEPRRDGHHNQYDLFFLQLGDDLDTGQRLPVGCGEGEFRKGTI